MSGGMSRREFLKIASFGAVAAALGVELEACEEESAPVLFFTPHERATIGAASARILPADQDPGAREARVVRYIENLLTAFDRDPPTIFGGGPFSGRLPYPNHATGRPSKDFPVDSFRRWLPLPRVKALAWRVRLFGSQAVPGGDFNDVVLGPTGGLRDIYRGGVQALDAKSQELFAQDFVTLTPEQQDEALAKGDQDFLLQLAEHTVEGMYAAPEYGGNRDLLGWRSVKFEGDSQPLGYSIFDRSSGGYREIRERPVSTPNPDEDFRGFDQDTFEFVSAIVTGVGGERFF